MIQYIRNLLKTWNQGSEVTDMYYEISFLATDLRASYDKGHTMEAAHSLKLQELIERIGKFTPESRKRLVSGVGRVNAGTSDRTRILALKLADLPWLTRVMMLPVQQRLRFMIAETDDSQKYNVKR